MPASRSIACVASTWRGALRRSLRRKRLARWSMSFASAMRSALAYSATACNAVRIASIVAAASSIELALSRTMPCQTLPTLITSSPH
eukprot:965421-Prymnesium_polylepis.1